MLIPGIINLDLDSYSPVHNYKMFWIFQYRLHIREISEQTH